MNSTLSLRSLVIFALLTGIVLLAGSFLLPWNRIEWGKMELKPASTIRVTGQAQDQQKSQVAVFTAGVNATNDVKEKATNEVNAKIGEIITAVKTLGIPDSDIKTQNVSVYQQEETYYEEGRQKTRPGQWRVSNQVKITLRKVEQASSLSDLLTKSGATNVYGPNFSVEDIQETAVGLLDQALKNATEKAEVIAKSSGRKLGKVISVSEGSAGSPIYPIRLQEGTGGGAPIEPGSSTIYRSVSVTFELK